MTLVKKLRLILALMLGLSLGAALVSIWSVQQSRYYIRRIDLSHRSYETHLALSSHTYQLFKQYGDRLIIGDLDDGAGERELIGHIREDIAEIRRIVGAEIDLVGDKEIGELDGLAEIELKIERLIAALDRVATKGQTGGIASTEAPSVLSSNWRQLSRILEADIDRDFRALIEEALTEEAGEVAQTGRIVQRHLMYYSALAAAFAMTAIFAAMASFWMIETQISRPVQKLVAGVRRFGEGDLSQRVALTGRDELTEVGATFDQMAEAIEERSRAFVGQTQALEGAVADRTRQLEHLLEAARRAEIDRRRMLADVSHELRTPLTIIQGEADIALRGGEKPPEVYRDALGRTRDAARHTARLVDDLLFVARAEAGVAKLRTEEIDLRALLDQLVQTFGRHVPLSTELDRAPLRADGGRIRQALLVLLENAQHHGGGPAALRLERMPDGYCVAVEDGGPGMSESEKASAFQRFFRGSNAAETYSEGVGLGLPVALAIAEAHGGTITLEDRPGGGLIATLCLPERPRLRAIA